jgi:hypothetical protein
VILAGIAGALLAAGVNAVSVVLLAAEARRTPASQGMHASLLRRLAHRRRWLLGTGLMVLAGVLQAVALAFAPLSIVQPTLSTSQLVLLAVARVKLGERVGRHEVLSALAILAGLAAVMWAAPRHSANLAPAGALAPPLAVVGGAALLAYMIGRARPRMHLALVLGAGVAYAWADFGVKLLAGSVASGRWLLLAIWLPALIAVGAVAFLEENSALQCRPAVTVAPVISAVKVPLPVVMALVAGLERWTAGPVHVGALAGGLCLVAAGAAGLGRSDVVARVSAGSQSQSQRISSAKSSETLPSRSHEARRSAQRANDLCPRRGRGVQSSASSTDQSLDRQVEPDRRVTPGSSEPSRPR